MTDETKNADAKRKTLDDIDINDEQALDEWNAQQLEEGLARVRANTREMQAKGILDEHGNRVCKDLPEEMLNGDKDCDVV